MSEDPLQLTIGQQFEIEKMNRVIDSTEDVEALRALAKQLSQAWMTQKAALAWFMYQNLPTFNPNPSSESNSDLNQIQE